MKRLITTIITSLTLLLGISLLTSCSNKVGDYWFMIGMEFNSKEATVKFAEYDVIFKEYYDNQEDALRFTGITKDEAFKRAIKYFDSMTKEMDQVKVDFKDGEYYKVTIIMDHPKLEFVKDKVYTK